MKEIITILALLLILGISAQAQPLTVHEWGTFTTLHSSEGKTLSGLYFEEETLPPFVYHFPGFSPDTIIRPCNNVTVKMETPVLYFYSSVERPVQVHVDFPNGTISQWFPNRSGGEETPAGILDLSAKHSGAIDWSAIVLSPTTTLQLTEQSAALQFPKWTDPRSTDANLVKNNTGEVEKYLFYRGLANFSMPVDAFFVDSVHLSVTNTSKLDIPFVYIYDHTNPNSEGVWGIGALKAGETKLFTAPKKYYNDDYLSPEYPSFDTALINAGLTSKEAQAMLNTWDDGYFQTVGFKIFWIVPRDLTDQILPLTITPKPDTLHRVLVGKTEVLTIPFERQLLADYRAGRMSKYNTDRYHLAYAQRAQELDVEYPIPHPMTVHQWGTLTSIFGSHGGALSGLYIEDQPLPPFVNHFFGFSPDSTIATNGYRPSKFASMRMEDPVINFYSDIERKVNVDFDFPNGTIAQWYPNRIGGEIASNADTLDFSQGQIGTIQWNPLVLARNAELSVTQTSDVSQMWEAERTTDANLLTNDQGETEKFLFSSGIGNVTLPFELYFADSNQLIVRNNSGSKIPFMVIYDHSNPNVIRTWGNSSLAQNESKVFSSYGSSYYDVTLLQKALFTAGLNAKEAQALVNTWSQSYPFTNDFKVFWIMARDKADNLFPLTINPWPDTLQRVFVGKTEILTLSFEKQLLDYYTKNGNLDKWNDNPYYYAYLQRVKELYKPIIVTDEVAPTLQNVVVISPNPGESTIQLYRATINSLVSIRNMLGVEVVHTILPTNSEIDIHQLPAGMYVISLTAGNRHENLKFIKK